MFISVPAVRAATMQLPTILRRRSLGARLASTCLAASLVTGLLGAPVRVLAADVSAASALSVIPVAVVLATPVALLSGGAQLSVVAVEASAEGTVWVLQRASDGARASVRVTGQAAGAASVAAGTVVTVTTLGSGQLLTAAGQALAFIPNALGAALLHNERVSR